VYISPQSLVAMQLSTDSMLTSLSGHRGAD
jgi:hypothetical protein